MAFDKLRLSLSKATRYDWTGRAANSIARAMIHTLHPHPDTPPLAVKSVAAQVIAAGNHWLQLRWRVESAASVIVPPLAGKGRADGLWQTTCFELFLRAPGADGYVELNLSPSERWAAYDFTGYREGMAQRPMPRNSHCTWRRGRAFAIFDAEVPLAGLPPLPWDYGLTAVIEEQGGVKSCWAMAHAPGKPDFHHAACVAGHLAAPLAA